MIIHRLRRLHRLKTGGTADGRRQSAGAEYVQPEIEDQDQKTKDQDQRSFQSNLCNLWITSSLSLATWRLWVTYISLPGNISRKGATFAKKPAKENALETVN
jgi:hypothetical protein